MPEGQAVFQGAGREPLVAAGEGGISGGDLPQAAFSAAEDERQPVMVRLLGEGRQAEALQEAVETGHTVVPQQEDRRDVKRTGEGLPGGHRAAELQVEILRRKTAHIDRGVPERRENRRHGL